MALNFPITFSLAPLPTGLSLDGNEYGQALVANLQASISGDFLTGQIEGTEPTQDVGPWAHNQHWYFWDAETSQYVQEAIVSNIPTGTILAFGGTLAPPGFVLCDGSLYLRTGTMGPLFSVIGASFGLGTQHGSGDGFSTFAVPDMRAMVAVGSGTSPGPGLSARGIGGRAGEENHFLIPGELAAHAHSIPDSGHIHSASSSDSGHVHGIFAAAHNHSIAAVDGGHTHSIVSVDGGHVHNISTVDPGHVHGISDSHAHTYVQAGTAGGTVAQSGTSAGFVNLPASTSTSGTSSGSISVANHTTGIVQTAGATTAITNTAAATTSITNTANATTGITTTLGASAVITTTVANHTTGITNTSNAGSGAGHNNMQPSLFCNFIIKT